MNFKIYGKAQAVFDYIAILANTEVWYFDDTDTELIESWRN